MASGDNSVAHLGWVKGPSPSRVSWGISHAVRTLGANVHLPYCARSNRKQLGSLFFIGKRTETHRIQPGEPGLKISRNPVTLRSVAAGTTEEIMLWRQSGLCTVMTVGTDLTSKCPHHDTEIVRNSHSWGNFKLGDTYYSSQSLTFAFYTEVNSSLPWGKGMGKLTPASRGVTRLSSELCTLGKPIRLLWNSPPASQSSWEKAQQEAVRVNNEMMPNKQFPAFCSW